MSVTNYFTKLVHVYLYENNVAGFVVWQVLQVRNEGKKQRKGESHTVSCQLPTMESTCILYKPDSVFVICRREILTWLFSRAFCLGSRNTCHESNPLSCPLVTMSREQCKVLLQMTTKGQKQYTANSTKPIRLGDTNSDSLMAVLGLLAFFITITGLQKVYITVSTVYIYVCG